MDDEGDDDIYAQEGQTRGGLRDQQQNVARMGAGSGSEADNFDRSDGDEDEVEEEEDSDSDIDIITEQKEPPKPTNPKASRVAAIKDEPVKPSSAEPKVGSPVSSIPKGAQKGALARSGASYPAPRTSDVDIDAKPIYEPSGKPITEIDLDTDVPEDDKAWRRPGTDMSDYFNYGFDEFTWASYCLKQNTLRQEISQSKKQMEEMQSFLGMPGGTSAGMGAMPGGAEFPPEMMQMMNQMMASGVNPQDASPEVFMQMMQGQGAGNGNMAQNYAAGQGYAQQAPNQQQMGFNYSGAGGNRGRGRRNW